MEKEVLKLINNNVLNEALNKWLASSDIRNLKLLGDVENFVYEFDDSKQNFILRITHSSHRSKELVQAEIDWLNFLLENKLKVGKPKLSINNTFTETIVAESGYFIVCAFEKAFGKRLDSNASIISNKIFITALGKFVGQLHSSTKNYIPKNDKRQQWFNEDLLINAEKYIPDQQKVLKEIEEIATFFKRTPQNRDNYGLIHADIHSGNYFIDKDKIEITLFDFDDSCYHYFVNDIAVIIYSYIYSIKETQQINIIAKEFTKYFLEGYCLKNTLKKDEMLMLPKLCRFRDLLGYVFISKKWDLNNLNQKNQEYFDTLKNRLDNNLSLVDFDYILNS